MSKIAILLATYNGETYIEEMLTSLEQQTYQDFVCYIHDDGSRDQTVALVQKQCQKNPTQYQMLEGPATGSAKANFMWMLDQVEADYYMFADQDDVWLKDKIEKTYQKMQEDNRVKCVFTDMYVTDEKLEVTADSFIRAIGRDPKRIKYSQIMIDNPAAGCTMLFDKAVRNMALELSDINEIEMHDIWVLSLAAALHENTVAVVDEPLVYYRQHGNNEMGAETKNALQKLVRLLKDICSGKALKNKKEFIYLSRRLAKQMVQVEELPEDIKQVLRDFSDIESKNKWKRIRFYKAHDFTRKSGTAWMLLWV